MGGLGDKVQIVDEIDCIRFCNPRDPEYVMAPEHCCSSFVIAHVEATDLQACSHARKNLGVFRSFFLRLPQASHNKSCPRTPAAASGVGLGAHSPHQTGLSWWTYFHGATLAA